MARARDERGDGEREFERPERTGGVLEPVGENGVVGRRSRGEQRPGVVDQKRRVRDHEVGGDVTGDPDEKGHRGPETGEERDGRGEATEHDDRVTDRVRDADDPERDQRLVDQVGEDRPGETARGRATGVATRPDEQGRHREMSERGHAGSRGAGDTNPSVGVGASRVRYPTDRTGDMLDVGTTAPEFELRGVDEGELGTYRLRDHTDAGEWVLLSFYAFDFEPICTEGMCSLRDAEFFGIERDLSLLGISGDGVYSHRRFADRHDIGYPLLADTSREVAERYDVVWSTYQGMRRVHRRALYLIDPDRTVRLATGVAADSPADIDLEPVVDAVREIRA